MRTDRNSQQFKRAVQVTATADRWQEIWDAEDYFKRTAELWETAQNWIAVVGWQLDSRLCLETPVTSLTHPTPPESLRDRVVRLCEARPSLQFYLLLWDHSIFYIPQREWLQTRIWEELHPRVHLVFDSHHPLGASHHEKLVLVDGVAGLTGSVDLCAERWDRSEHRAHDPGRSLDHSSEQHGPYHELGVEVAGGICRELSRHLAARWNRLSSVRFPEPVETTSKMESTSRHHRVHLSRTLAIPNRPIIREVEFLFLSLISRAEGRIWMEGQYFWSRRIQQALLQKMRQQIKDPAGKLNITLVLTHGSQLKFLTGRMNAYQHHLVAELQAMAESSNGKIRFEAFNAFSENRPIYIHSKILLVDDRWLSVGSANFSERAFRMDTEIMLTLEARTPSERRHLDQLHGRLRAHWKKLVPTPAGQLQRPAIAWEKWLDPPVPPFHFLGRRLPHRRTQRRLLIGLAWLGGYAPILAWTLQHIDNAQIPIALLLSASSYSTWILPVPASMLTLLILLRRDPQSELLALLSLWMAAAVSVAWGRMLPSTHRSWLARHQIRTLSRFGQRRFTSLLLGWLDPTRSTFAKLHSQSHFLLPIPWILLVGCILSAAWVHGFALILRWIP